MQDPIEKFVKLYVQALSKKFEEISPNSPRTFLEIHNFRRELSKESDRGCVLAATSLLEEDLGRLLATNLVDNQKIEKEMFHGQGPLATFSSRINMAYMMSLISQAEWRNLHLIRKIRNNCAHSFKPVSFQNHELKNRCTELTLEHRNEEITDSRHRFILKAMDLLASIHVRTAKSKHLKPRDNPELSAKGKEAFDRSLDQLMRIIDPPNESDEAS